MGRDLQEYFGQEPQAIMTLDILPGTDGVERMSKSTGNYIGVTEDPRDMYGKVMSIPDGAMMTYFRLLTPHHADELARIEAELESGAVNPRDLKARLAREIITRLRGAEAAAAAEEHFDSVFRRHEAAGDLQELALEAGDVEDGGARLPAGGVRALVRADALRVAAAHPAGRRLARRRAGHRARRPRRPARRPPPQGGQVGASPGRHPRALTPAHAGAPPPAPAPPPAHLPSPLAKASPGVVDTPRSRGILPSRSERSARQNALSRR